MKPKFQTMGRNLVRAMGDVNELANPSPGGSNTLQPYVHDPESLYNEVGQEQFLHALIAMRLRTLSFPALKQLVRTLLLRSGYASVRSCGQGSHRKTWGEGGLELLAFSHTDLSTSLTAIQLKQHREPIPRRFVDELRGVVLRLRADVGLIVATSLFSSEASEAAGDKQLLPVHLIDNPKLTSMLLERGMGVRTVRQGNDLEVRRVYDTSFFDALETSASVEASAKGEASAEGEVGPSGTKERDEASPASRMSVEA